MRTFMLSVAVLAASMLTASSAFALDISTILSSSDATSNMEAAATFVIGIVVGLFAISVVRRALGK